MIMSEEITETFLTKTKFSKMVEETVLEFQMSYMDAIVFLCTENNIEIEDVKKYISTIIKSKLEVEAMNLNYLPRQNSLPFD